MSTLVSSSSMAAFHQSQLATPQYAPQQHIAFWLSSNDRFQVPKSPAVFLQQMRDGTLIWRLLTAHLSEPPPPSESITERWRQIASALLDCGVELTPHGLKLLLLGEADVLDKVLNVVYSLHHAGGQGTSAVASLMTPCVPEPEVLYPRLFHSTLVNAKQTNFVDRVKALTGGCCTPDTSEAEREFLQLEALSSHSKRLVEYGMAEAFFRLGLDLMFRQRCAPLSLKVASLMKTFVLEVGPESSFKSLVGQKGVQHALRGWQMPLPDVDDYDDPDARTSAEMLDNVSLLLRTSDTQPELQDFIRMLLTNICSNSITAQPTSFAAAPTLKQSSGRAPISPTSPSVDPSSSAATLVVDDSKLVYLFRRIFPTSVVGHRVFVEQMWAFTTRVQDRTVVRAIALWLSESSVAILEGREPGQDSYGRFNPNARFEEGYVEPSAAAASANGQATASALVSARGRSSVTSITTETVSPQGVSSTTVDSAFLPSSASAKPKAAPHQKHNPGTGNPSATTGAMTTALKLMPRDDDDEDGEDAARQAKRMADVRFKLQKQQGQERRERDVCGLALRLCLRLWSEFIDIAASSDLVYDVVEFIKTTRGMELLCGRPDLVSELACAMFSHQSFYNIAIECLEQNRAVNQTPELRRLLLQNLCDYHSRPYPQQLVDDAADLDGEAASGAITGVRSVSPTGSTATNSGPVAKASRTMQLLGFLATVGDLYPQIAALGVIEGDVLMMIANGLVTNLQMQGPVIIPPQLTAGASSNQSSAAPLVKGATTNVAAAFTATNASSMFDDTQRSFGGYGSPTDPSSRNSANSVVTLKTVRQFFDLLVSLMDQDPFFHRPCVLPLVKVSHYFLALPQLEPVRSEFLTSCLATTINDLLSLAERHHFTELILQGIAQIFLEHGPLDGRRGIAECVHMFFQILVRRDFSERPADEASASEVFGKRMRKLCELVGMPTIRVKVKVLDDEEAARIAAIRKAEEEERKRAAAEEAERVRQEMEDREDQLALENGKERRKKYVRQPLYCAPEPLVRAEDVPQGTSIFEHKRNLHWVKNHLILDVIMDRVLMGIVRVDYNKQCSAVKRSAVAASSANVNGSSNAGMPESFWSGWQRGKTYEEQQQLRRKEEESEAQRRDILRKIRDQEVKDALKTNANRADTKKLQQLFATAQQHLLEEEHDRRSLISNTYLKGLVSLYHMFREEHEHYASHYDSVSRQRAEETRRRQQEERQRAKEKVNKYWEEKEHLEAQLEAHRQQRALEDANRNELKKKAYLDGQKRRLMTWRLENQYGDESSMVRDHSSSGALLSSSSSTTMTDGPGRAPHVAHTKPAGGGTAMPSKAQAKKAAHDADGSAVVRPAGGHNTKLAPLTDRAGGGRRAPKEDRARQEQQHQRPRRRSSEPAGDLGDTDGPNEDDHEGLAPHEHLAVASEILSDDDE